MEIRRVRAKRKGRRCGEEDTLRRPRREAMLGFESYAGKTVLAVAGMEDK